MVVVHSIQAYLSMEHSAVNQMNLLFSICSEVKCLEVILSTNFTDSTTFMGDLAARLSCLHSLEEFKLATCIYSNEACKAFAALLEALRGNNQLRSIVLPIYFISDNVDAAILMQSLVGLLSTKSGLTNLELSFPKFHAMQTYFIKLSECIRELPRLEQLTLIIEGYFLTNQEFNRLLENILKCLKQCFLTIQLTTKELMNLPVVALSLFERLHLHKVSVHLTSQSELLPKAEYFEVRTVIPRIVHRVCTRYIDLSTYRGLARSCCERVLIFN